ncbi:hypothetical protein Scep_021558 [Stephania cephalantha]|uniref:Uncharacterized protein n=1 Tax=Stephania cephalantha TaxID=152367 RepID=A0AAP0I1Z0_9MAGN
MSIMNRAESEFKALTDCLIVDDDREEEERWISYMARVKAAVSRQDVDGEPTRAQRRAEVATTSTSPSAPADRGKRRS